MKGKWLRRGMAVGIAAALGNFCGCGLIIQPPILNTAISSVKPTQIQPSFLEFPQTLPDSTLIVEAIVHYQGRYWEDGSGDMVQDVAGIMLYNPTDRMIEFEAIALEQEGEQLYFFAYQLPPQSRCLVLERKRKTCEAQKISACRELSTRWGHQEFSRERVDYVGLGPLLTIVNRDSGQQEHITVRYKQYVKEGDYYLGGVAYSAHLFALQPEERRTVTPEHYHAGKARIVAITVNA